MAKYGGVQKWCRLSFATIVGSAVRVLAGRCQRLRRDESSARHFEFVPLRGSTTKTIRYAGIRSGVSKSTAVRRCQRRRRDLAHLRQDSSAVGPHRNGFCPLYSRRLIWASTWTIRSTLWTGATSSSRSMSITAFPWAQTFRAYAARIEAVEGP